MKNVGFKIGCVLLLLVGLGSQKISAETLNNADVPGKEVLIWTSQSGFLGCMEELKATGLPGRVCSSAILAAVPSGTLIRRIPGSGYNFPKIQTLGSVYGGITGYVPRQYIK